MNLYLSSYEYSDFEITRKVLKYQKIMLDDRNVLVVQVDKHLIGQKYGLLNNNVSKFYLVNRVDENAFNKLDKFPIDVFVLIVKSFNTVNPSSLSELQNIAWACLYDNEADAKSHKLV